MESEAFQIGESGGGQTDLRAPPLNMKRQSVDTRTPFRGPISLLELQLSVPERQGCRPPGHPQERPAVTPNKWSVFSILGMGTGEE